MKHYILQNLSDDSNGLFLMERDTGVLRLKRDPSEAEIGKPYILQLRAVNITSGESDQAQVCIKRHPTSNLFRFVCLCLVITGPYPLVETKHLHRINSGLPYPRMERPTCS